MAVKNSNLDNTNYKVKDKTSDSVLFQGLFDNLLKGDSGVYLVLVIGKSNILKQDSAGREQGFYS